MFITSDGVNLHAWKLESKERPPRAFIAYFHGNAQNLSSHFLNLAWVTTQGIDFWIFDYRGYGESDQVRPTPSGTVKDGIAALYQAYEHFQSSGAEQFILHGQSLGGIILMRALEEFSHRDKVDLLILDSTFYSYKKIARRKKRENIITWPLQILTPLLFSDRYAPQKFFEINQTPTLVIHSKDDPVVPSSFGPEIYNKLNLEKKWFWKLPKREHGGVFHRYDMTYRKKILDLLNTL